MAFQTAGTPTQPSAGGSALIPVAVFGGFAAGRIATTIAAAVGDATGSSVTCLTVDAVRSRIVPFGYIEGGIAVAVGACLLLGVTA